MTTLSNCARIEPSSVRAVSKPPMQHRAAAGVARADAADVVDERAVDGDGGGVATWSPPSAARATTMRAWCQRLLSSLTAKSFGDEAPEHVAVVDREAVLLDGAAGETEDAQRDIGRATRSRRCGSRARPRSAGTSSVSRRGGLDQVGGRPASAACVSDHVEHARRMIDAALVETVTEPASATTRLSKP